jgi:hypothetical protein
MLRSCQYYAANGTDFIPPGNGEGSKIEELSCDIIDKLFLLTNPSSSLHDSIGLFHHVP